MPPQESTPSQRVRVRSKIHSRDGSLESEIVGTVVWQKKRPTGSWHAHGRDGRLWLQRIRIRKDDGELVDVIVDEETEVTPVAEDAH